jgi:hypothetical protein
MMVFLETLTYLKFYEGRLPDGRGGYTEMVRPNHLIWGC